MAVRVDGTKKYYLAHYVVANTGLIHKFLVLHTVDRKGKWRPAVPDEVVPKIIYNARTRAGICTIHQASSNEWLKYPLEVQFSVGFWSMWSITRTCAGRFVCSSLRPSCFSMAS